MFIMVDGIDGSGKGTIIEAWKEYLTNQGNAIFDLKQYWKEKNEYPELAEIKSYDFIFSCEPTRVGIGRVIREELISADHHYPPRAIAEAYSLDRLILYTKIIIPLLKDDKMIIQDRGISSSLAYQTAQSPELTFSIIANLTGNALAMEHRPDFLVLAESSPTICATRLASRSSKKDNAIFETIPALEKNAAQFHSREFQKIFIDRGAKILSLNTEDNIDIIRTKAVDLLKTIINQ